MGASSAAWGWPSPTWAASASGELSRLLCLNQAAAAMRVIEVGVMLPGARVSSAPLPLVCDQFDHSLFCCCSRCASCRAHIRRPPGVLHGHQRRFEGSDGSKKLAYRY